MKPVVVVIIIIIFFIIILIISASSGIVLFADAGRMITTFAGTAVVALDIATTFPAPPVRSLSSPPHPAHERPALEVVADAGDNRATVGVHHRARHRDGRRDPNA